MPHVDSRYLEFQSHDCWMLDVKLMVEVFEERERLKSGCPTFLSDSHVQYAPASNFTSKCPSATPVEMHIQTIKHELAS